MVSNLGKMVEDHNRSVSFSPCTASDKKAFFRRFPGASQAFHTPPATRSMTSPAGFSPVEEDSQATTVAASESQVTDILWPTNLDFSPRDDPAMKLMESVSPLSAETVSTTRSPSSCAKASPVMTPVPAKPERPSPAPSPSVNKKAKCSAPPVPDSMMPPPEAPLKKTKTEKACAVKGTGRPPATPLANPLAAPPPVAAHAAMVLRPPPPKGSPPACPETEPSPGTPAYVNVHGVPVPMSKAGVKMEVRPTQNTAAAALRKQKARPSMKVEQREDTLPPSASLALDTSAKASRPTSPTSPTSTESTAPSPSSAKASPTSAKAISPSSTTAALAKANTPSPDDHSTAPTPAKCPAPTPTPDDGKTTETDIQREERVRAWVCKMDDVEITRSIQKAERHSLFPQFELWRRDEIFGVGGDEDIPRFGADDEEEELVSWLMWLEDPSRPCVENALPDPNPEETASVAVAKKPKQVTFTQNVTVHSLPDTAVPAKATTSILKPAAKMPVLKPLTLAPAPPMKASAAAPPQAAPAATPLPPAPARATPATATTLPVPPPAKHAAAPHVPAAVPPGSLALLPPASASPKPAASPLPAAPASNGMIPASQLASQIHISAPVGAEVTFEGYKERQAHYAQMKRQLDASENYSIPDEIVASWKQAVQSRSRAAKNAVFQSFLKAGKDWSKLSIKATRSRTDRTIGRKRYGWKTRAQLMAMHNDEQTVNRIIDMKTRNSEFKEHPDSPGDANATLFYVLLDMERVDEDEHEDRVDLSVSGEATGEQAERFASETELNAFGGGIMCEPLRLHSLQLPKSEGGAVTPDRSVAAPSAEGPQGKPKAAAKPKPKSAGEGAGRRKNEMPDELRPRALWILNKLSGDLQGARMWPVKLAHLKHQEALSKSFQGHADELERSFIQLTRMTVNKEIDPSEVDQLTAATTLALQRMQLYQEDAGEANTLTKPTRSSGSKDKAKGTSSGAK